MKIKLKNILMISILAVAGIFGVSSAVINKQVNEQPVAEKAEATDSYTGSIGVEFQVRWDYKDNQGRQRKIAAYIWDPSNTSSNAWTSVITCSEGTLHYSIPYNLPFDPYGKKVKLYRYLGNHSDTPDHYNADNAADNVDFGQIFYISDWNTASSSGVFNLRTADTSWTDDYSRRLCFAKHGSDWEVYNNSIAVTACQMGIKNLKSDSSWYHGLNGSSVSGFSDNGNNIVSTVSGNYAFYLKFSGSGDTIYIGNLAINFERLSPTASTFRLWCRGTFDSWYAYYSITAVRVTISGVEHFYSTTSVYNSDDGLYYWYSDVPTNIDGYQHMRVSADGTEIYNFSVWTSFGNVHATEVTYINSTKSGNDFTVSFGSPNNPSVDLFKEVIKPFCTCLNSSLNGYSAYGDLNTNWYSKLDEGTEIPLLASTTISDFSYDDYEKNGKTYDGISERTASVTVASKWAALSNMNTSGNPNHAAIRDFSPLSLFADEDSLSTVIIIVASSVALLSITVLSILVIKKRKNKQE